MNSEITLAHGSGGEKYRELVREVFLPAFSCPELLPLGDSAVLKAGETIAMTTDGYVVQPMFFPGGDIGSLAVSGTVNDLAVSGAVPRYISVGMILEAGLPMDTLVRVCSSMALTAAEVGVSVVTGDTKVVGRGLADGMYITTSGVGVFTGKRKPLPQRPAPGDAIIASGCIACHGTAVMAAREGLDFSPPIKSDARPLSGLISAALDVCSDINAMRDPTRGGVAATLCEWAGDGVDITIFEEALPLRADVRAACSLLGLDPLFIANEGVVLLSVPEISAAAVLKALRGHLYGRDAAVIGRADSGTGAVRADTGFGTRRKITLPSGELLPRIC